MFKFKNQFSKSFLIQNIILVSIIGFLNLIFGILFFTLPITIRYKDGLPETKISQFHSLYRVRLKMIHPLLFGGNLILQNRSSTVVNGIINDELFIGHDVIQDSQNLLNSIDIFTQFLLFSNR